MELVSMMVGTAKSVLDPQVGGREGILGKCMGF